MTAETLTRDGLALEEAIASRIGQRTSGRLRRLRVEASAERVVVRGATSSYYIKQLALQAALEVTRSANGPQVELDIAVL